MKIKNVVVKIVVILLMYLAVAVVCMGIEPLLVVLGGAIALMSCVATLFQYHTFDERKFQNE